MNLEVDKTLDQAAIGEPFIVRGLLSSQHGEDWDLRLEELGFMPGERVTVMARAWPSHDPLVVRIGLSTFALRAEEAACVRIFAATEETDE